ncbi:MAG: hypothetical protein AAFV93_03655 [Chloroflexota bacterium]
MQIILAHGSLGYWDEFFFLGIAIVFSIFMGISWWRSRQFEAELEDDYAD